jgi:hypothetical protein
MTRRLKIIVLSIGILTFVMSLTQPAFYTSATNPAGWANSLGLLVFGWSGTMCGGAGIAWLANPLIFTSWFYLSRKIKVSVITGILAAVFAVSFLLFKNIITDEAGNYSIITDRKAGYWLWLTSIVIFTIGTAVIYYLEKRSAKKVHDNMNA